MPFQPFYFFLDTAEVAAASARVNDYEQFFAKFVFGGNGSGELIAFDMGADAPWPVAAIDMTNMDLEGTCGFSSTRLRKIYCTDRYGG
jgi:hypothetical protein